jgi:tetratricopeptide (TPR) repeat protein
MLAGVLMRVDRAEAEQLLRGALDAAAGAGDDWNAVFIAGQLFNLLLDVVRLDEALALAERLPELTAQAGLGPWSQLADWGSRLQVLGLMGDHARVLAEVGELRTVMAGLPARRGTDEAVDPWNVREGTLGIGRSSALATGEWSQCLELNAEKVASMRGRGAGVHEATRFRFNDAGALIRLGRLAEAERLLAECQRVFEDHADIPMLGIVLSARADLESHRGNNRAAADLERAALRLSYARPEPRNIAISHHNLAIYLGRLGDDRATRRAHRLAAALIRQLAGMSHYLVGTIRALTYEMREDGGTDPSLPSTVAQVIAVAEQTEGVHLSALLTALQPDESAVEAALAEILAAATAPPADPEDA